MFLNIEDLRVFVIIAFEPFVSLFLENVEGEVNWCSRYVPFGDNRTETASKRRRFVRARSGSPVGKQEDGDEQSVVKSTGGMRVAVVFCQLDAWHAQVSCRHEPEE